VGPRARKYYNPRTRNDVPVAPLAVHGCSTNIVLRVGRLRRGDDGSLEEPGHASQPAHFQLTGSVGARACDPSKQAVAQAIAPANAAESANPCSGYLNAAVTLMGVTSVTVQLSVVDGQVVEVTAPPQPVNV
jgi:hypothetical protein